MCCHHNLITKMNDPFDTQPANQSVLLVLLFAPTEGRVQQDSSHLQFIVHNLVQLLKAKYMKFMQTQDE